MLRSPRGFEWRKSQAHLLFLSKFLYSQAAQDFAKADYWRDALEEPPQRAIKRFMDEGILVSPSLSEHLAYKYKVSALQVMLKQRGLPVSGRKVELISRLVEADPGGMEKAVADLTVLQCSDRGREIASQYLTSEKEKRATAEQEVLVALQKSEFREAGLLVSSYQAKQVFPPGMVIGGSVVDYWKNYDPSRDVEVLKGIFGARPKTLALLDQGKLESLRLVAGMIYLWGPNETDAWLLSGLETGLAIDGRTAARMLISYATNQVELEEFRRIDLYESYEIRTCNDEHVCAACRELAAKKYKLSDVPELPYEQCTNEKGCRCSLGGADIR
jgi:hypothetical protein